MNKALRRQKEYWDRQVSQFDAIYSHRKGYLGNLLDRLLRWDMYERFNYTMRQSQPVQGRRFLDVGCGTGRYSLEYALQGAALVVGIDVSENMIATSSERAKELNVTGTTRFMQADLLSYNPDSPFHVCVGIGLFDYIRDPLPVMKKMRDSVEDKVIMSFPTIWTWKAAARKLQLSMKGCEVFFYTESSLRRLLKEAGFSSCTLEKIGQLYCVTALR
jgi:2-polyprenyl-3-methyl-5-hydroxy-6-metoxy-1,4-benzoquinol methylase